MIPWKLIITCVLASIILRFLYADNTSYLVSGVFAGAIIAIANHYFDLGLIPDEKE